MESLTFDNPASYLIRVQGRVWESWYDHFEGMTISLLELKDGSPISTLVGVLSDQAALVGVLYMLYTLHLPVLSVECLGAGVPFPVHSQ